MISVWSFCCRKILKYRFLLMKYEIMSTCSRSVSVYSYLYDQETFSLRCNYKVSTRGLEILIKEPYKSCVGSYLRSLNGDTGNTRDWRNQFGEVRAVFSATAFRTMFGCTPGITNKRTSSNSDAVLVLLVWCLLRYQSPRVGRQDSFKRSVVMICRWLGVDV